MKHTKTKLAFFALIIGLFTITNASATQNDISGPAGSERFGQNVATLPNGNIVITDPYYDAPGPIVNVGAVYLYNGATGALISTLTGSTANDFLGYGGITTLTNGNYVIKSPYWNNPSPSIIDVGAVTWCGGTAGCSGSVSADNSLIGSRASDSVGGNSVLPLSNGNYVVVNPGWDNPSPAVTDVGAITWGNGAGGTVGVVSSSNSLVGGGTNDRIGEGGVTSLTNGNYVVRSPFWDNLTLAPGNNVGAATWGNGTGGTIGLVSASNSLVGGSASDNIGYTNIYALSNGNYVVNSPNWHNPSVELLNLFTGASTWGNGTTGTVGIVSSSNSLVGTRMNDYVGRGGVRELTNGNYIVISPNWGSPSPSTNINLGAATWCNGTGGTVGVVSASNSLIGGTSGDNVGGSGVIALSNGNYVVSSMNWDNSSPSTKDVGAATWGNGAVGTVGLVSSDNSLIGGTANDLVGNVGISALSNGNYVVTSKNWDNPSPLITDVGAATWGNGAGGTVGLVSASNSLVGGSAGDNVGISGVRSLSNGNYVVCSLFWDNPSPLIKDVGAATWGNGTSGITGLVSESNSLVGNTADAAVGNFGIEPLTNGNYVVRSPNWDNPVLSQANNNAGAVTWGNGSGGITGVVSESNSLVGGSAGDIVGVNVRPLTNGNYVVTSTNWDNPSTLIADVGAVTWGNGAGGTVGLVSSSNSLVGGTKSDNIGDRDTFELSNGNYVVCSSTWDDPTGSVIDAGAISYGIGTGGTVGLITANNSVRGTTANSGSLLNYSFDIVNNQLVVGRPPDNIVSLFKPTSTPKSRKRLRFL